MAIAIAPFISTPITTSEPTTISTPITISEPTTIAAMAANAPPKISHRLDAIMELVPNCDMLIDVGCDHGKLCEQLLECDRVQLAYATDISQDSLSKARLLLSKFGARHHCILADGLTFPIMEGGCKPCVITISGMGGLAIIKILEQSTIELGTLILQPQNKISEVRAYLVGHGYSIVADKCIIDDNRFYDVIKAVKCSDVAILSDIQLEWGVFYSAFNECLAAKATRVRQKILNYNKLSSETLVRLKLCEEVIWAQQQSARL